MTGDGSAAGARVGVVGSSIDDPCGVRDHAVLLADALRVEGLSCTLHWLWRTEGTIGRASADVRTWTHALPGQLERERADAVLLHYSVFALSHRGLPAFVRPALSALRKSGKPVVTFMHEYAYPWRLGGARGKVWAATQRAALIDVMRAILDVIDRYREAFNVLHHEARYLERRPQYRTAMKKIGGDYLGAVAEIIERGRRTGVIHFEDSRSAVHAIHMLCAGWAMGANNLKGTDKETYWREIAAIVEGRFFGSANGASTASATR